MTRSVRLALLPFAFLSGLALLSIGLAWMTERASIGAFALVFAGPTLLRFSWHLLVSAQLFAVAPDAGPQCAIEVGAHPARYLPYSAFGAGNGARIARDQPGLRPPTRR